MIPFRFKGIYAPLITPFEADGSINWAVLSDLVDHLIARGVHGLISGGSTGENYAQSVEERIRVAAFTRQQIAGRIPFVVGTGAMLTSESVALAAAARNIGADAILLASPPYAVPTDYENAQNALTIADAAGLPVMLYNYPHRTGTMMGTAFLETVAVNPLFCGIKESSGDINRLHLLASRFPTIQLGCGMDDQALEFFAWGAPFWVCGGANFLPDEHIALYQACVVDGDFVTGRQIMAALLPLMHMFEQGGKFVQTIKHGVQLAGFNAGIVRPPLGALGADEAAALAKIVTALQTDIRTIIGVQDQ